MTEITCNKEIQLVSCKFIAILPRDPKIRAIATFENLLQGLPLIAMNINSNHSLPASNAVSCVWTFDDQFAGKLFSVLSIIQNLLTCPPTVILNVLVIIAVKTKPRLQTTHHLILASMAATDLAVGIVIQPVFIAREIARLTDGLLLVYCKLSKILMVTTSLLCLTSFFHLVMIALERLIAIKYSLNYNSILTKRRLAAAIALCWIFAAICLTIRLITVALIIRIILVITIPWIFYCHFSVYFVCRRHLNQIKSGQTSGEATAKFLEDQKAWKTTTIILGCLILSFLPEVLRTAALQLFPFPMMSRVEPIAFSCVILNSFFNPVIYCWRSQIIRQALTQLVRNKLNNV